MEDIRWHQRLQHFERALNLLKEAVSAENLSVLEQEGMVKRFEYTFELSWKTMKDFLQDKGGKITFPRDVIKEAFTNDLIDNGELWLEMLENRNILSHVYDENKFKASLDKIKGEYVQALNLLVQKLKTF